MIKNVILVQPPLPANERHKKVLPLGLAYVASYLRRCEPDSTIRIVDAQAGNMSIDEAVCSILRYAGKEDCVGVTYWTCQAPAAYRISQRLKKADSGITVIHGGVHATIFPEEALESADYCVLHEGEITFAELVRALKSETDLREVAGIAYKDNGRVMRTDRRDFIEDLDSLPFPAWDLLDMKRYDTPLHVVGGNRLPVIGSRGCPYSCTFCGSPFMWKKRPRWRSPENIVSEMKAAIKEVGLSQFHFWDDNLMLKRSHIEKLCTLIIEEGLKIRWTGLSRASHIAQNADLLGIMKEAGCIGLEVGIESANPDTFVAVQKQEELRVIEEVARCHKANGMSPMFTFMAFNPGETISSYYDQARFIDSLIKNLPWYPHFHMFAFPLYVGQFCTPHPGTELYGEAPTLGELLTKSWEDYHHHQINFVPRSLLDDVPLRNIRIMTPVYFRLCNFVIQVVFWTDFSDASTVESKKTTLSRYRKFLVLFWLCCNGKNTVEAICLKARNWLGLSKKEAIRFGALTCLVLGQIGVIKSALHDSDRKREVMHIVDRGGIPEALEPSRSAAELFLSRRVKEIMSFAKILFR